jgi:hypothetical protein
MQITGSALRGNGQQIEAKMRHNSMDTRVEMKRKKILLAVVAAAVLAGIAILVPIKLHHWRPGSLTIQGAVIRNDSLTRKQLPISGAKVTVEDGVKSASAESDASGYFRVKLPGVVWPGKIVNLSFRHADYLPLDLQLHTSLRLHGHELQVAAMTPIPTHPDVTTNGAIKQSVVSNIRIRYTVNSQTEDNIGSAVRTFQIINKGGLECNRQKPCSPDGVWKATENSISLDAGPDNEFRNVRASCIAGPCPFTQIDSNGFANGGRNITVSALDWSDTTTFLVQAEVFRTAITSNVRDSYPVIFGRALNFTAPPAEEGVTIEAEIDGTPMVFPLGPELYLSWATCTSRGSSGKQNPTVFLCELKPGFQF